LLVWQATDERHEFEEGSGDDEGPILADAQSRRCLLISERRQALVAVSPVGDLWVQELEPQALELESSVVGRSVLRSGSHRVRIPLGDEATFTMLLDMPALEGGARKLALARGLWLRGGKTAGRGTGLRAQTILREIAGDDPLAALTLALLFSAELVSPSADPAEPARLSAEAIAALERLAKAGHEGEQLLAWWRSWELGPELGELVVEHLCELGPGGLALALALHEQLRPILQAKLEDEGVEAAVLDFVLAEHLLALDRSAQALALLEERRGKLPSEQLQDLLPPSPERGGQQIRIELLALVAAAHERLGDGHVAALAELARLQPLMGERLTALIEGLRAAGEAGDPALLARAELVRAILDEGGFAHAHDGDGDEKQLQRRPKAAALDSERLEQLRHPAARVDGVLGRMQGALAKVAVPDRSQLKAYCERANLARLELLARAIADATIMLGVGGIEPYVSRGDKSVGLRAYEDSTSFMLIGADHLDADSHAYLEEAALRFAVTCEIAHLRFAHNRVTSDEVWSGTLDLGLTGLSMLVAAAPILKGLKAPARHLLDKVGAPAIDRWRKKLAKRDSHSLASDNSQLIAAHRVMQLSADRAGLVACGDPRAAIRAMFAVHPAHLSQWPLVESHGLRTALTRATRDDDPRERQRLDDLAVRVAALLSFYLSPDYAALRAAAFPGA
ncbi:MAG: hypothetical protein KC431_23625, partial [Myxococcales bacterium]|nr:hypothetical protein [Myxococcales bacterium]